MNWGTRQDHRMLPDIMQLVDTAFKDIAVADMLHVWPHSQASVEDSSAAVASARTDKGKGKATSPSQSEHTDPGPLVSLIIALRQARRSCDGAIEEVTNC
jgi:hypothetical protein